MKPSLLAMARAYDLATLLGDLDLHLGAHAVRRLGDSEIPSPALVEAEMERRIPLEIEAGRLGVTGKVAVDVFNAADDRDPAAVFGPAPAEEAKPRSDKLQPGVRYEPGSAWLAIRSSATMEAGARAKVPLFGASGSAEGGVAVGFHDYRRHDAGELVGPAVARDLATARFAVFPSHVRALRPGEALAVEVNGTLGATVSLRWADVLTSHVGALGRLLAPGEDFGITLRAGARASFEATISDHFLLVFSRREAGRIEVSVRKSDRREFGARAVARVSVRLASKARVEAALRAALEGLLGGPLEAVREVLGRTDAEELSPSERAAAERLIDRFGMEGDRLRLEALRARIEGLEAEVGDILETIAEQRAQLAVDFSYSHVRADETLIEATLDEARLGRGFDALHRTLVRGELDGLLEEGGAEAEGGARARAGVSLHRFLEQETVKTIRSWGVALEVGDLFSVRGKARSYLRGTLRRDRINDRSKFTFSAIDSYAGEWGRDSWSWKTTLAGTQRRWSPGPSPSASALRYSLGLLMEYGERELSARDAGRVTDFALLWGILSPGGAPAACRRLADLGRTERDVRVALSLRFRTATFDILLRLLAAGDARGWGGALARAAPWLPDEPGRDSALVRHLLYADLWRQYLEDSSLAPGDLAGAAAHAARRGGHAGLAGFERRMRHWWTVGELARANGDVRGRLADLAAGAERLRAAIAEDGPHTEIEAAARLMRRGWEHGFHMRALGAYLAESLRGHPTLWSSVTRVLRVTYGNGDDRMILNLSST